MPFDFRRFDIYRKVPKDLTQPTYTGAIISICCCLFILFLFLSELTGFITTEVVNELYVDDPDKDSGGKIDVSLNISLPNLHCELVGLDIQDEMGRHEVGHIDNSMKIPLNSGAGCRFEGQFSINKVPGNFHVSTHSATAQPQNPDMTHVIHKLSFGDTLQVQNVHGAFNALGGADRLTSNHLCHYRWDLHCCRHSGLLYLHSLRGVEKDPAGQDALTTCRPNGRGPRETTSPAPSAPSPPALLSGPGSGCIPKWGWGEVGRGSRFCSYLLSPPLILHELHCQRLWCPLFLGEPQDHNQAKGGSSGILGTTPWRAAVPSLLGEQPRIHRRPAHSQALTILKLPPFGRTNHLVSPLGNQPADRGSQLWTTLPPGTSTLRLQ
uniref:Endoplasmic reticulum-Golgi intermediate compartment protein n=1 Tax=Suricata suricatta TaxID=37032 RepID=A0A673U6Y6_SURSU